MSKISIKFDYNRRLNKILKEFTKEIETNGIKLKNSSKQEQMATSTTNLFNFITEFNKLNDFYKVKVEVTSLNFIWTKITLVLISNFDFNVDDINTISDNAKFRYKSRKEIKEIDDAIINKGIAPKKRNL